jgi:hypothetical protein
MGYQELGYAVVEQAINDYRENRALGKSVYSLTKFFKSNWCKLLLKDAPITGLEILEHLKSEPIVR